MMLLATEDQMITTLTAEQRAQIQPTIDRWIDLASAPLDMERLRRGVNAVYRYMGRQPPVILIARSPLSMVYTDIALRVLRVRGTLRDDIDGALLGVLRDHGLAHRLASALRATMGDTTNEALDTPLDMVSRVVQVGPDTAIASALSRTLDVMLRHQSGQTYACMWPLTTTLDDALTYQLDQTIYSALGAALRDAYAALTGMIWWRAVSDAFGTRCIHLWRAPTAALYEYAAYLGMQFDPGKYQTFLDFASQVHAISAYDGLAIVGAKPTRISWIPRTMSSGYVGRTLHNASGPSIEYADGWRLWHLNGIPVPEWAVTTPADQITVEQVLAERNVDVQRELIRKVGTARLMERATEIDRWTDPKTGRLYRLMEIEVVGRKRRYMHYEHASVPGIWYAQLVPHEVTRCIYARAWQLGMVTREEVANPRPTLAAEIEANLPQYLS